MNIRPLARLLYAFVGTVFLLAGVSVLLLHTGVLPGRVTDLIVNVAHGEPNTIHIIQEFGSLMVFAGLISFWFVAHYAQSKIYHWSMTAFWALFSFAHWFDARGFAESVKGPLINTIPLALFLLVGLFRAAEKR